MLYSRETLQATLDVLTVDNAMRMIALAGSKMEFETLIDRLARNFGAEISTNTRVVIQEASKRWHAVRTNKYVSYSHE